MNNKNKLRDKIIEKAGALFRRNGYRATSNRQISKAVGCTTAALYYHFKNGKSQILREVIYSNIKDPSKIKEKVKDCKDLNEFLIKLTEMMVQEIPRVTDSLVWLLLEFPKLPKEERAILQEHIINFHNVLESELRRFTTNEDDVVNLAWISVCAFFGFYQLFLKMGISSIVGLDMEEFGNSLTKVLSTGVNI
ncbi:MAG: TetR/AcrR family transcriptional regulator [Deltaproteobacteria bacterium]|nr:TetR/AcrR family transcriptional regulator [Deltaproteobacteria bacterium]